MDETAFQAAIFVLSGGVFFAVSLHYLFDFFSIPPVNTRQTMVLMASVAILFWATGIMPLLVALRRPVEFQVLVSLMFSLFVFSCMCVTYLISQQRKRNGK